MYKRQDVGRALIDPAVDVVAGGADHRGGAGHGHADAEVVAGRAVAVGRAAGPAGLDLWFFYTSDAAAERFSVRLVGPRLLYKKNIS